MKVVNLSAENSILQSYIREIRDIKIQNDPMRFRKNIERIGYVMAIEISRKLNYTDIEIQTPLAKCISKECSEKVVIASILRAGLALHNGLIDMFDRAENAFVSAYRKYRSQTDFDIHVEYISSPDLNGKTLILADPMLATGGSMELAYEAILSKGKPKDLHIASVIASKQAIEYLQTKLPEEATLWVAAIDPELNEHAYIVPGLGDAGDLAFGEKID